MSVQYEKALQLWGAKKLKDKYGSGFMVDLKTVEVKMDFDEGYQCGCHGNDPQCYCSLAVNPTARVLITGMCSQHNHTVFLAQVTMDHYEFDFVQVLGEIVDAADGEVTREAR